MLRAFKSQNETKRSPEPSPQPGGSFHRLMPEAPASCRGCRGLQGCPGPQRSRGISEASLSCRLFAMLNSHSSRRRRLIDPNVRWPFGSSVLAFPFQRQALRGAKRLQCLEQKRKRPRVFLHHGMATIRRWFWFVSDKHARWIWQCASITDRLYSYVAVLL